MKVDKLLELEFDVRYSDGSRKEVKEGILFEFQESNITLHLGTSRKECLFSIAEALTEAINDMNLGKEFLEYIGVEECEEVHCKDCEYYGTYDSPEVSTTWCKNENGLPGELDPEDGCSRGKKKEKS